LNGGLIWDYDLSRRMPRVTVGLPFFDEQRRIGDAIRSVLAQSFTDFELLLVDDGSRDGSLAIARSFRDPRIRVIADGQRRHLPARLNEIIHTARAPYVARMDADDVMHPTRLARQLAVLDAQPACDVVGTWVALADGRGRVFAVAETGPLPPSPRAALMQGVLAHATVLGKREWFAANPYDETLTRAEDRDLWCRTAATARFAVVPECLYVVRVDVDKDSFARSYVETQSQNRRIFATYGPGMVGRFETSRLIALTYAKSLVMRGLIGARLADRLVRRRGRPPTASELALAYETLAAAAPSGPAGGRG
jgi:glycosyltransferase involved in cell wall biosynthesis